MELVQTTSMNAFNIIEKGNRKIKAQTKRGIYDVISININNDTCIIKTGTNSASMQNNEDITFFIAVPKNANKVF